VDRERIAPRPPLGSILVALTIVGGGKDKVERSHGGEDDND